jgi:hypothetical protein
VSATDDGGDAAATEPVPDEIDQPRSQSSIPPANSEPTAEPSA